MKDQYIINNKRYTLKDLSDIWDYFRTVGHPYLRYDGYAMWGHTDLVVDQHRGYKEFESLVEAYDNLEAGVLFKHAVWYHDQWKQAEAKLQLKGRKPLTEKEFKAQAYEEYLEEFNKETERLEKLAEGDKYDRVVC